MKALTTPHAIGLLLWACLTEAVPKPLTTPAPTSVATCNEVTSTVPVIFTTCMPTQTGPIAKRGTPTDITIVQGTVMPNSISVWDEALNAMYQLQPLARVMWTLAGDFTTLVDFTIPPAAAGRHCGVRLELNPGDPAAVCAAGEGIQAWLSNAPITGPNDVNDRDELLGTINPYKAPTLPAVESAWSGSNGAHDIPCAAAGSHMVFELVPTEGTQVFWGTQSNIRLVYG